MLVKGNAVQRLGVDVVVVVAGGNAPDVCVFLFAIVCQETERNSLMLAQIPKFSRMPGDERSLGRIVVDLDVEHQIVPKTRFPTRLRTDGQFATHQIQPRLRPQAHFFFVFGPSLARNMLS